MHFGLDFGSHSIKVLQASKKGNKFVLDSWGIAQTKTNLDSLSQKDKNSLAENLKKLIKDSKISTSDVVVALPETKVYSRVIQLPPLSDAELASAIEFEAEQYIPLPLDQVQLEYLVLTKPPKGLVGAKMEVLLIAAQKKAISEFLSILEMAGLVPVAMETEILAASRSLANFPDTSLMVNVGSDSTDLAITKGENLRFVYSLGTGGEVFTRSISQQLSLEMLQAEEYKKAYGLDTSILEGKVAQVLLVPVDQIVKQIQKTINFYLQKNPDDKISRLIICGGSALMPGIAIYMTKAIGLETVIGNPLVNFITPLPQELLDLAPSFSTCVGLATREV